MSRTATIDNAFKAALAARLTSEDAILLCEISHDDITTVRLAQDREDITSGGNVYSAWDFDLSLPQERADRTVSMNISFDNSNHLFTPIVRAITGYASVDISVVSGSDPDTVQVIAPSFSLINAQYFANRVTGVLSMKPLMSLPFPGDSVTPGNFPGSF